MSANEANIYYENMIDGRGPREDDEITPIRKVSTQEQLGLASHRSDHTYEDPMQKYKVYPQIDKEIYRSVNSMIVKKRQNYRQGNTKWIHAEGRLQYLRNDSQNPLNLMMQSSFGSYGYEQPEAEANVAATAPGPGTEEKEQPVEAALEAEK